MELGNTRERQTKRSQQAAADAATMQAREAELQELLTVELNRELHVLDLFAGLKCAWGLSPCLSLASHIRLALLRSMASAFEATCPYALKLKVTTLDDDSALRYEGEPRPQIDSFDADIKEDIIYLHHLLHFQSYTHALRFATKGLMEDILACKILYFSFLSVC